MKRKDITDVEDCMYKIEALLKEYNCYINFDKELGGKCILVDNDTNKFEQLPFTSDYDT